MYPGNRDTKRGGKRRTGPGIPEALEGVCRIRTTEKTIWGPSKKYKGRGKRYKTAWLLNRSLEWGRLGQNFPLVIVFLCKSLVYSSFSSLLFSSLSLLLFFCPSTVYALLSCPVCGCLSPVLLLPPSLLFHISFSKTSCPLLSVSRRPQLKSPHLVTLWIASACCPVLASSPCWCHAPDWNVSHSEFLQK